MTVWPAYAGAPGADVAAPLLACFAGEPFELRWSLAGTAAARVLAPAGPVAAKHAEPPDPPAPWSAGARCGAAAGWLLAPAPPANDAAAALQAAVDRHTALVLQRLAAHRGALLSDLLEVLTHRLRTDVTTLQAVAEGTLMGLFAGAEREEVAREVKEVGRAAQRQLTAAREAMSALAGDGPRAPEPIAALLRAELEGAGVAVRIEEPEAEQAHAALPAPGWAACARLLAEALATDSRLAGATVRIAPDPLGWTVDAGAPVEGRPAGWSTRRLGALAGAGHIAAAGGGTACSAQDGDDRILVRLTVPAGPSR